MPIIPDKPQNKAVINTYPANQAVLNTLPKNQSLIDHNYVYTESRTINAGQSMGLLLALTYPTTITFTGERI